jgi:hypothetical protein
VSSSLSGAELVRLVERVFRPGPDDDRLAFLVDLPDAQAADHPAWSARREMVADWHRSLLADRSKLGLEDVRLIHYANVGRNNADLPDEAVVHDRGQPPSHAKQLVGRGVSFASVFDSHRILIAATEFSATAPLKLKAREHGFRAATMPGFSASMIPALQLDYEKIDRRCRGLKVVLDQAESAILRFEAEGVERELQLDLRHRRATASGGLVREPGTAGNLPSGETYIVPYEGERSGDASRSRGVLPLELDGELLAYRIERNRIVEVLGQGPRAAAERREVAAEPAYANVAELGLGILGDYGVRPVGEILLDEKLGLHIAFGRSDHFGGSVGAQDFTSPERVVHIDRVYLPEVQPRVRVLAVDLEMADDPEPRRVPLMQDGRFVRVEVDT